MLLFFTLVIAALLPLLFCRWFCTFVELVCMLTVFYTCNCGVVAIVILSLVLFNCLCFYKCFLHVVATFLPLLQYSVNKDYMQMCLVFSNAVVSC